MGDEGLLGRVRRRRGVSGPALGARLGGRRDGQRGGGGRKGRRSRRLDWRRARIQPAVHGAVRVGLRELRAGIERGLDLLWNRRRGLQRTFDGDLDLPRLHLLEDVRRCLFGVALRGEPRQAARWRRLLPVRPRDVRGHGVRPAGGVHLSIRTGPLKPVACLGLGATELDRALEHLLRPLGVAAPQEDLAEPPIDAPLPRLLLSGRDERRLGIDEAAGFHVEAGHRDEHGDVARVTLLGEVTDLLHERRSRVGAQRFAKSDRGRGVGILLPTLNEDFDRVVHGSRRQLQSAPIFHCRTIVRPTRAKPIVYAEEGGPTPSPSSLYLAPRSRLLHDTPRGADECRIGRRTCRCTFFGGAMGVAAARDAAGFSPSSGARVPALS